MQPAQYPGCSGTRNLHDNLSDLRAQVAANRKVCTSFELLESHYQTLPRPSNIECLKKDDYL